MAGLVWLLQGISRISILIKFRCGHFLSNLPSLPLAVITLHFIFFWPYLGYGWHIYYTYSCFEKYFLCLHIFMVDLADFFSPLALLTAKASSPLWPSDASSGLSTGVCLVNLVSNWLTSSSDCYMDKEMLTQTQQSFSRKEIRVNRGNY